MWVPLIWSCLTSRAPFAPQPLPCSLPFPAQADTTAGLFWEALVAWLCWDSSVLAVLLGSINPESTRSGREQSSHNL